MVKVAWQLKSIILLTILIGMFLNAIIPVNAHFGIQSTTSTSFTSTSNDGSVRANGATYAAARDATTGIVFNTTTTTILGQRIISTLYYINRAFFYFDTSSIPEDATITEWKLSINITAATLSGANFSVVVTNGQSLYPHKPMVTGDYDRNHYQGNGGEFDTSTITTLNVYYNTTPGSSLNATRNWINSMGYTKLTLRSSRDISGTAPSGDAEKITISNAEAVGGSTAKLYVTYWTPTTNFTAMSTSLNSTVIRSPDYGIIDLANNALKYTWNDIVIKNQSNQWQSIISPGVIPCQNEAAKYNYTRNPQGNLAWNGTFNAPSNAYLNDSSYSTVNTANIAHFFWSWGAANPGYNATWKLEVGFRANASATTNVKIQSGYYVRFGSVSGTVKFENLTDKILGTSFSLGTGTYFKTLSAMMSINTSTTYKIRFAIYNSTNYKFAETEERQITGSGIQDIYAFSLPQITYFPTGNYTLVGWAGRQSGTGSAWLVYRVLSSTKIGRSKTLAYTGSFPTTISDFVQDNRTRHIYLTGLVLYPTAHNLTLTTTETTQWTDITNEYWYLQKLDPTAGVLLSLGILITTYNTNTLYINYLPLKQYNVEARQAGTGLNYNSVTFYLFPVVKGYVVLHRRLNNTKIQVAVSEPLTGNWTGENIYFLTLTGEATIPKLYGWSYETNGVNQTSTIILNKGKYAHFWKTTKATVSTRGLFTDRTPSDYQWGLTYDINLYQIDSSLTDILNIGTGLSSTRTVIYFSMYKQFDLAGFSPYLVDRQIMWNTTKSAINDYPVPSHPINWAIQSFNRWRSESSPWYPWRNIFAFSVATDRVVVPLYLDDPYATTLQAIPNVYGGIRIGYENNKYVIAVHAQAYDAMDDRYWVGKWVIRWKIVNEAKRDIQVDAMFYVKMVYSVYVYGILGSTITTGTEIHKDLDTPYPINVKVFNSTWTTHNSTTSGYTFVSNKYGAYGNYTQGNAEVALEKVYTNDTAITTIKGVDTFYWNNTVGTQKTAERFGIQVDELSDYTYKSGKAYGIKAQWRFSDNTTFPLWTPTAPTKTSSTSEIDAYIGGATPLTELISGWNNLQVWEEDIGHTLGEVGANIKGEGIQIIIVTKYNGSSYQYTYGGITNIKVTITVISDELQIYVTSDGTWTHSYTLMDWLFINSHSIQPATSSSLAEEKLWLTSENLQPLTALSFLKETLYEDKIFTILRNVTITTSMSFLGKETLTILSQSTQTETTLGQELEKLFTQPTALTITDLSTWAKEFYGQLSETFTDTITSNTTLTFGIEKTWNILNQLGLQSLASFGKETLWHFLENPQIQSTIIFGREILSEITLAMFESVQPLVTMIKSIESISISESLDGVAVAAGAFAIAVIALALSLVRSRRKHEED